MSWRSLLARSFAVGAIVSVFVGGAVFVGVRLAVADPGGPTTPNELTFAGVLRERIDAGATTLTFIFRKGATPVCVAPSRSFTVDGNGAFSVRVPLDVCTDGGVLFDGNTVVYDVRLGGATGELLTPTEGVPITPVPYARFADQAGINNDCPVGYERAFDAFFTLASDRRLCQRVRMEGTTRIVYDEVVRVGRGASAFWIDRYEATVWSNEDSSGGRLFRLDGDFPTTAFPRNGQWRFPGHGVAPAYARSVRDDRPASWITWFQAAEACLASGKRLPTGNEWLAAANGTPDPGANDGSSGACITSHTSVRAPVSNSSCVSGWGAQNMIGNVMEFTDEWYAGAGSSLRIAARMVAVNGSGDAGTVTIPAIEPQRFLTLSPNWPTGYGDDGIANVNGTADRGDGEVVGIPAVALRGGSYNERTAAGVFYLNLNTTPTNWHDNIGFRCVIPR